MSLGFFPFVIVTRVFLQLVNVFRCSIIPELTKKVINMSCIIRFWIFMALGVQIVILCHHVVFYWWTRGVPLKPQQTKFDTSCPLFDFHRTFLLFHSYTYSNWGTCECHSFQNVHPVNLKSAGKTVS